MPSRRKPWHSFDGYDERISGGAEWAIGEAERHNATPPCFEALLLRIVKIMVTGMLHRYSLYLDGQCLTHISQVCCVVNLAQSMVFSFLSCVLQTVILPAFW